MVDIALTVFTSIILVVFCAIAAVIDIKSRRIPNWISISLFAIWILIVILKLIMSTNSMLSTSVSDVLFNCGVSILSAAVVAFLLAGLTYISNKLKKSSGNAFGMGDIKLLMVMSLYFGPVKSFVLLAFTCVFFCLYCLVLSIATKKKTTVAAFAPSILVGVIACCIISVVELI